LVLFAIPLVLMAIPARARLPSLLTRALSANFVDRDGAGAFLGTLNIHGRVHIDETGHAYTYAGVVEPADPSASVVATFPVTTSATQIRVDHTRRQHRRWLGRPHRSSGRPVARCR
jgi:hypothetical protein